jgi:nucleoside-diphosphate-sugar epimerase
MTLAIVTGATGWLGSRLVQALLADEHADGQRVVRCLVQPDADAAGLERVSPALQIVRGDLTQPETLQPLFEGAAEASVFHIAGIIHPGLTTRAFFDVNVRGTEHLLNAAIAARAQRLILVSSNSPFGTNPSREHTFDESSAYHPYMKYGKSKMRAERLVQSAHDAGDIETVIVRSPWFYGPGQPPRQTLFFRMIRDGKVPVVGDGGNRRSMAYVDNICQGLLLAERSPRAAGEAYWIADRRPYTMNEIIAAVEAVLEREFQVSCRHGRVSIPGFVGEVATAIDASIQAVGLYHQKLHVLGEMNKTIACSISKAEQELGYNPSVELEEGMKRSIQWLVQRGEQL